MKTFIIVMALFCAAVVGGFFYIGMGDVSVRQTEKTVEIPFKTVEPTAEPQAQ